MDWIVGLKPLSIWQSFIVRWCAFTSVKFYLGLIFCIMCKKKLNSYDHVLSLVTGFMTEISFSSTLMSSSTLFPFSVCSATRVSFLLSPQHTVKAHNNEKRSDQAAHHHLHKIHIKFVTNFHDKQTTVIEWISETIKCGSSKME